MKTLKESFDGRRLFNGNNNKQKYQLLDLLDDNRMFTRYDIYDKYDHVLIYDFKNWLRDTMDENPYVATTSLSNYIELEAPAEFYSIYPLWGMRKIMKMCKDFAKMVDKELKSY